MDRNYQLKNTRTLFGCFFVCGTAADRFMGHLKAHNGYNGETQGGEAQNRRDATKEVKKMLYSYRYVDGHVEVYDEKGSFLFSADSQREATQELRERENAA